MQLLQKILPHPHAHTPAQTQNKKSPSHTPTHPKKVDVNQLKVGSPIILCTQGLTRHTPVRAQVCT